MTVAVTLATTQTRVLSKLKCYIDTYQVWTHISKLISHITECGAYIQCGDCIRMNSSCAWCNDIVSQTID